MVSAAWPTAPTGVEATAVSGTQIDLSWSAVTGAEGYTIYVQINGSDEWTEVGSVEAPTTSYSVTGLDASGTGYSFRVTATNEDGASAWSNSPAAQTVNADVRKDHSFPSSAAQYL